MTWIVRLTAREQLTGSVGEHIVRVEGDRAHDLLNGPEFKWKHLEKMMERGSLLKVEIDYRPTDGRA